MRYSCTFRSFEYDIQFDRTGYQQFLREQELSEYDITHLNIHLITNFTLSHFKGNNDLAPGGAFFQRGREYIEQENKTTKGLYREYDPPSKYAAIFLRPGLCHIWDTSAHLNHTFLHETRHHIQHCLKLSCCSRSPGNEVFASLAAKDQPWEIDAEEFADKHFQSHTFLQLVPHHLQRSDLQWMKAQS
jgi:hypothetical protein